jgi:hypothetical protein
MVGFYERVGMLPDFSQNRSLPMLVSEGFPEFDLEWKRRGGDMYIHGDWRRGDRLSR